MSGLDGEEDWAMERASVRHWSRWRPHPSGAEYTLGVEEDMLVHPEGWSLAHQVDRVIGALEPEVAAAAELAALRRGLDDGIASLGLPMAI